MKQSIVILISCCVVTGLIFLSFTALPSLANALSVDNIKPLNILLGLFYSIMLSHPYIRTTQLILNQSKANKEQTFSDFRRKGMAVEYLISRGGYLLIGIVVIWMALTSLFKTMLVIHYLIVLLYGLSIILLDWIIEKVVLQEKDESSML